LPPKWIFPNLGGLGDAWRLAGNQGGSLAPNKNVGARGRCVAPPPNPSQAAEQEIPFHRLSLEEASRGLVHSMHICIECALLCCDCEGLCKSRVRCREGLPSESWRPEIWLFRCRMVCDHRDPARGFAWKPSCEVWWERLAERLAGEQACAYKCCKGFYGGAASLLSSVGLCSQHRGFERY
jgi:hypothetical protein